MADNNEDDEDIVVVDKSGSHGDSENEFPEEIVDVEAAVVRRG
jgi:hypothetical protein